MSGGTSKRKTVFIKRRFQASFVAWVIGLLIVCCLCSAAVLYPLLSSEISSQLSAGHRDVQQASDRVVIAMVIGNLLAILIATLASAVVILYITHKIAGPLYRFERLCEEVGRGNYEISAALRETDQLKDLSRAFGAMLSQLRARQQGQRLCLENMLADIRAMKESVSKGALRAEALDSLELALQTQIEALKD